MRRVVFSISSVVIPAARKPRRIPMKKLLLSIAAVAAMAAAVPAMAQPFDHGMGFDRDRGAGEINQRIQDINFRIDRGARDGSLDRREVRMLRGQVYTVRNLEYRYARDGLDWRERADLSARLDRLSYQVRGQRHDGDRGWGDQRDGGRGYGDGHGGDRSGPPIYR
jgi:hypothetical protein